MGKVLFFTIISAFFDEVGYILTPARNSPCSNSISTFDRQCFERSSKILFFFLNSARKYFDFTALTFIEENVLRYAAEYVCHPRRTLARRSHPLNDDLILSLSSLIKCDNTNGMQ